ncbi:MAG: ABC transporter ATP-binding protein [Solobacterium sp.]|jgi:oligopeptide/dipeptide ABC transporter ATP-binding protein|nr:ABC transporter ATP-binding protein [Solobacterium sp.]
MKDEVLMNVSDFSLAFPSDTGFHDAVSHSSFVIHKGEICGLIGESGCGKSMTALSMMGLQPGIAKLSGSIVFRDRELLNQSEREWQAMRGGSISMIFQEPMTALNPLMKAGRQIAEVMREHRKVSEKEAEQQALHMISEVKLPDPLRIFHSYPHQLSGGQKQRIMIAMAFMNEPELLIADEPTTALDVTVQAQILDLIRELNRRRNTAVLMITHNLDVVRNLCDTVNIMYAGMIVESGPMNEVLDHPRHPYTRDLMAAIPSYEKRRQRLFSIPGAVPPLAKRNGTGCPFADRCSSANDCCRVQLPDRSEIGMHTWRCFEAGRGEADDC